MRGPTQGQRLVSCCCWHVTRCTGKFTAGDPSVARNGHLGHRVIRVWPRAPSQGGKHTQVGRYLKTQAVHARPCTYVSRPHTQPRAHARLPASPELFCVPGPVPGTKDTEMNWPHSALRGASEGKQDKSAGKSHSRETDATLNDRKIGKLGAGPQRKGINSPARGGDAEAETETRHRAPQGRRVGHRAGCAKARPPQETRPARAIVRPLLSSKGFEERFLALREPQLRTPRQPEKGLTCRAKEFRLGCRSQPWFLTARALPHGTSVLHHNLRRTHT